LFYSKNARGAESDTLTICSQIPENPNRDGGVGQQPDAFVWNTIGAIKAPIKKEQEEKAQRSNSTRRNRPPRDFRR
jgi:hypothetical protein